MSAMAAAPPPRLDTVLSFGNALPGADADATRPATDERDFSDAGSDYDDAGFEFALAPPLGVAPGNSSGVEGVVDDLAPADDLFAHGRILPAYPVFDRHHLLDRCDDEATTPTARLSAAPPSPDTYYCPWAPRSAPRSPARDFAKSASTGDAQARRSWRLRDLVSGASGRSHSDGKEKFLFLQPTTAATSKVAGRKATVETSGNSRQAARPSAPPPQKQSRKKGGNKVPAAVTDMDMATAHKLFYGKQGGGALAGDRRQQQSYLPYRPGIVGFFTATHALGRSHHPY